MWSGTRTSCPPAGAARSDFRLRILPGNGLFALRAQADRMSALQNEKAPATRQRLLRIQLACLLVELNHKVLLAEIEFHGLGLFAIREYRLELPLAGSVVG